MSPCAPDPEPDASVRCAGPSWPGARLLFLAGLLLAAVLGPSAAAATTVPYRTDGELIAMSDRVVHALVLEVRAEPVPGGGVATVTRLAVVEDWTGIADRVIEVRELGGILGDRGMWVAGAPRFTVGERVVLCLERANGALRTVALSYSAFRVVAAGGGEPRLARMGRTGGMAGAPAAGEPQRGLAEFRALASAIKGRQPARPNDEAALQQLAREAAPSGRVEAPFTLLGGGIRWHQADTGTPVVWYRNSNWPSPLVSGSTDNEIQVALDAWTQPSGAGIVLAFGGTRSESGPAMEPAQFCTSTNNGAGLITFGDPGNDLASGVLAIGGGCFSSPSRTVNGQSFFGMTHGYVIFNDQLSASFTTPPNFTRVMVHEIGHGIGLGHTCEGAGCTTADQVNIMYPSCCAASAPVPPALGPDDLAGLRFIYPDGSPPCTYTLTPTSATYAAAGGTGTVTVTASAPTCGWTATSSASWMSVTGGASGTGNGAVNYSVAGNGSTASRQGSLLIAGQAVAVSQAGVNCTLTVTPTSVSYGAAGGQGTIQVTAPASTCPWTAASNASWVSVTAGASGTGNGSVNYTVAANIGGAARSATLSVTGAAVAISQAADTDVDNDTLPDAWEVLYGLRTSASTGDDGPTGDPDGDGRTNLQEFQAGTHPRGFATRYLAEGAVNSFFDTELALLNPGGTDAIALLRLQPQDQAERSMRIVVPALTRATVTAARLGSLTTAPFATVVESDQLLVVDRTMRWDATHYGAHADTSVAAPSTTWYLAEGSTSGEFALFYLLQNPNAASVQATVRFLRPGQLAPIDLPYTLPPNSRTTIPVDTAHPSLASTDVAGVVTASLPIIVERAMYLSRPGQAFAAGHESAGVTAPATEWFLAEGATGTFFELFLLIANPDTAAAEVTIDYLLPDGTTVAKAYTVGPNSRFTIWVDEEQFPAGSGNRRLANTAVAMRARSTNGVPVIVERAMWWPQPAWYEAHHAPGTTASGTRWALAAGEVGAGGVDTYVLIANVSPFAGQAMVTLYFEDGTSAQQSFLLPANSRTNVPVRSAFPAAVNRRFGTIVQSVGTTPAQIVIERAMYASPAGVTWAAGTAAVGTRLP